MKKTHVFIVVLLSALIGATLGISAKSHLGMGLDPLGANNHANEIASQLKIKAAVLYRLSKNDHPCAKKLLVQTMDLDRKAIEQFRSTAKLEKVTLARMDDSIELAGKSLGSVDVSSPEMRCD